MSSTPTTADSIPPGEAQYPQAPSRSRLGGSLRMQDTELLLRVLLRALCGFHLGEFLTSVLFQFLPTPRQLEESGARCGEKRSQWQLSSLAPDDGLQSQ